MLLYKTLGINAADLEKRWQECVNHVVRSRSPVTHRGESPDRRRAPRRARRCTAPAWKHDRGCAGT
jgi:hypothetical protein